MFHYLLIIIVGLPDENVIRERRKEDKTAFSESFGKTFYHNDYDEYFPLSKQYVKTYAKFY